MKEKLLGYYNYTVILTYVGMLIGMTGILCTIEAGRHIGLLFLMAAGVCDMFDGKIAMTKKDRTEDERSFGIQIDSLSDLICFGVLPGIIMCRGDESGRVSYAFAAFYCLCALIRLAWYNVDEQNRQRQSGEGRKCYRGLPVTTVAMILPLMLSLASVAGMWRAYVGLATLFVTGILFLCPFQIKKPGCVGKCAMILFGLVEFVLVIAMGSI